MGQSVGQIFFGLEICACPTLFCPTLNFFVPHSPLNSVLLQRFHTLKSQRKIKIPQIVTSKNIFKLPDGKYPAGEGLLLFVRAASRTWIFRYQINGKRRDLSLGSAKTIPISSVRQKAQELKVLIANCIAPKEQRDNKNKEEDLIKTFDEVAKEAIDLFQVVRQWKNEKHAAQWRATISKHASPVIGKKKISEITRDDILNVLNPIWSQ